MTAEDGAPAIQELGVCDRFLIKNVLPKMVTWTFHPIVRNDYVMREDSVGKRITNERDKSE